MKFLGFLCLTVVLGSAQGLLPNLFEDTEKKMLGYSMWKKIMEKKKLQPMDDEPVSGNPESLQDPPTAYGEIMKEALEKRFPTGDYRQYKHPVFKREAPKHRGKRYIQLSRSKGEVGDK